MGALFFDRRLIAAACWMGGPLGAASVLGMHWAGLWQIRVPEMSVSVVAMTLLLSPLLEELAFRGGLQELIRSGLHRMQVADDRPLSWANLITTAVFCAYHLPSHSFALASMIAIPSLLLGRLYELTRSLKSCVAMHMWFNTCFLFAFWSM